MAPDTWDFDEWLGVMADLEKNTFKHDFENYSATQRADYFMMCGLAAHSELTEMMDEIGWKPWDRSRGWVHTDMVASECADLLHFVAHILNAAGVTGEMLTDALVTKVVINKARQAKGDDTQARRCLGCKRSLDDTGTTFLPGPGGGMMTCTACGERVSVDW